MEWLRKDPSLVRSQPPAIKECHLLLPVLILLSCPCQGRPIDNDHLVASHLRFVISFHCGAHLKDGTIWIGVDGNNALGILHASKMLDCTGHAHSDVQVRCHHLPSLPNLHECRLKRNEQAI